MKVENLHPQYVTDGEGRKKAVILPIEEFDELCARPGDVPWAEPPLGGFPPPPLP
jgi:hypothetical protein